MMKYNQENCQTIRKNNDDAKVAINYNNLRKVTILKSCSIFIKSLSSYNYSENTIKNYEGDIKFFQHYIKTKLTDRIIYINDICYQHLELYKEFLIERNSCTTASRKFNCLRTYFKILNIKGLGVSNIIDSLKEDEFGIQQEIKQENLDEIRKQILSKDTIDKLYMRIKNDKGKNMRRDLALFNILFIGLSRSEVLMLKWDDINFDNKTLTINRPKNSSCHIVELPDNAYDALIKYYKSCICKVELQTKVFNISTTPYNKIIKKYTSGLKTETGDTNIVGHCTRHSAIIHMLRANVPLTEIQKIVGISITKLQVYTYLSTSDAIKSATEVYTSISA